MSKASWQTQAGRFLAVGVVATLTDAGTYIFLMNGLSSPIWLAKSLAFILGTTVSYLLNKRWTFEHRTRDPAVFRRFLLLYGVTLVCNVAVNEAVITALSTRLAAESFVKTLAYLLATATSTLLNFVGSRAWVFRESSA